MKKRSRQKLVPILLLVSITAVLAVPRAFAQEVELIPPASNDYKVEASPYQGQDYQVRTANPDPITDWIIKNTLGEAFNKMADVVGPNVGKWIGDTIHYGIVDTHLLFAGDAWKTVRGYCTPTENFCADGFRPQIFGGGNACDCVPQTSARPINPADYGVAGIMGGMTMGVLDEGPPNLQPLAYLKQELADNILASPAYAQTGATYFDPVMRITEVTRNLAYIFMSLILIGMGLMVMTRRQVSPRAVMTVSAALPRVVFSIILIAFSYPLAGFLVDIGRLAKALIDASFGSIMPLKQVEPFELIPDLLKNFNPVTVLDLLNPTSWGNWGNISLGGTGTAAYFISLGLTIVAIVIIFMLFFTLVFRFASLFVQVIFAPLAFAWGALPGQEDTISRWFRSFAVNVLTFPTIYFLVNLSTYIAKLSMAVPLSLPVDLGWGHLPSLWRSNVGGLVAFGILMAATKVPAMLEEALEVTPSAAVSRAGVEPMKVIQKVPVIGGIFR